MNNLPVRGEQLLAGGLSEAAMPDTRAWLRLAEELCAQYNWQLTNADRLVIALRRKLDGPIADPHRALIREYYSQVYAACRDADNPARREQAFVELGQMLYRVAFNKLPPDAAAEVTNNALAMIWEKMSACRSPETFLDFALYKLKAAITDQRRFERHNTTRFLVQTQTALLADDNENGEDSPLDEGESNGEDVAEIAQKHECAHAVLMAIDALANKNQREVLTLDLTEDIDDAEIAARLELSSTNVRKLRFDGLRKLGQNPLLKDYDE